MMVMMVMMISLILLAAAKILLARLFIWIAYKKNWYPEILLISNNWNQESKLALKKLVLT